MRFSSSGALLGLLALALAACGSGGSGESSEPTTTTGVVERPVPEQPLVDAMAQLDRALASQRCEQIEPLVFSVIRGRPPGAPATAAECSDSAAGARELRGYHFIHAAHYGTGAIMEAPSAGLDQREVAVWVLDSDGRYRFTRFSGTELGQIGTAPPLAPATAAARRFVAATRGRDCTAMERLLSPRGRLVVTQGGAAEACKLVLSGRYFAPAVRRSGAIEVKSLGGTQNFVFVGVPTRAAYFTIVLSDAGGAGMRVLDVLPSTPVKLRS